MTKYLNGNAEHDILEAAEILKKGGTVALPTETVYGLAADARNILAVEKIFIAKERPRNHPLIVHVASMDEALKWVNNIPEVAQKLIQAFWPGPLTLILKKAEWVSDVVTGGLDSIAMRMPDNEIFLKVLKYAQTGVAAPSANIHKKVSPTSAQHVKLQLDGKIDAVLDGGLCTLGIESTIVDITGDTLKIVRLGPISVDDIADVAGCKVEISIDEEVRVSGNMKVHYQPRLPVEIATKAEILSMQKSNDICVIYYSDMLHEVFEKSIKMPSDAKLYGGRFYAALHEGDQMLLCGVTKIIVEALPQSTEWSPVKNRLDKAAAK